MILRQGLSEQQASHRLEGNAVWRWLPKCWLCLTVMCRIHVVHRCTSAMQR